MNNIRFIGGDEDDGDVFIVETTLDRGHKLGSHVHRHPHMSVLVSGTAIVTVDGESRELSGYNVIRIPANTTHEIEALTSVIWLCIWADHLAPREEAFKSLALVES